MVALILTLALAQQPVPTPVPVPVPDVAPAPEPQPEPAPEPAPTSEPVPVPVPVPVLVPQPAPNPFIPPAPIDPEPVRPEPVRPEPVRPEPAPVPVAPVPVTPAPVPVHTPVPTPSPSPVPSVAPAPAAPFGPPMPSIGAHGLGVALRRLLLAAIGLLAAEGIRRVQPRLMPNGALPALLRGAEITLRLGALALLLAGVTALLPVGLWPLTTWIVVAAALGLGWSARDIAGDLVAGVALQSERKIVVGTWVEGPGFAGTVRSLGLRSSTLRRADGARQVVPHRHLAQAVVLARGADGFPVTATVELDPSLPAGAVRPAVVRALATAPWTTTRPPEIGQDPSIPGQWAITAWLLDPAFADRYLGTLRERVHDELALLDPVEAPHRDVDAPRREVDAPRRAT